MDVCLSLGTIGLTVVAHASVEGASRAGGFCEVVANEADGRGQ